MIILDLHRPIVIHLFPGVWSLDGWYISAFERSRAATWCSFGEGRELYRFVRGIADHLPQTLPQKSIVETVRSKQIIKSFSRAVPTSQSIDQRRLKTLTSHLEEYYRITIVQELNRRQYSHQPDGECEEDKEGKEGEEANRSSENEMNRISSLSISSVPFEEPAQVYDTLDADIPLNVNHILSLAIKERLT
eukprot:MONOS_14037.1-p1 / transcript=MONOS_14037.1 / gene=MONOS_14037 / organism=Monocercomonoides_exilis_PA203 / gene_product=unspecified product / transcript_product=unspecified product / location=Mono_scaffold00926:68-1051(-) / protein_length=190 / sequence_SO=supercontig / SO=protein_coding / is_pseudo=false